MARFSPLRYQTWHAIRSLALLISATVATPVQHSQDPNDFAGNSLVRLSFHSSIVLGNTLYIDGGEVNYVNNGTLNGPKPMNDTLSIDLTLPFNNNNSACIARIPKPAGAPVLDWSTLWPSVDNDSFYNFGGIPSGTIEVENPANNVWKYAASSGNYVSIPSNESVDSPSLMGVRPASGFSTYDKGKGYLLGGYNAVTFSYPPVAPVPGLLVYDTTQNSWANESAQGYSVYGTALNGRMHSLSTHGGSDLLVILGGEVTGPGPWQGELGNNLVPFTNISLFDTTNKVWYWQTATGATGDSDIPPPAVMFCSAIATAAGSGTTEIFVYGGHNDAFVLGPPGFALSSSDLSLQGVFDTVYVLSIPGFVWFKVDSSARPRTGHTCERIGNRHMISIGGLDPTLSLGDAFKQSDPWNQSLGVFDMVELNWTGNYDPSAPPYEVPQVIGDWYAKPTSNSSVDWNSEELKSLFLATNTSNSTATNTNLTSSSSTTPTIVGSVVGTLVGLTILALVASLTWYRRRQQPVTVESGRPASELKSQGSTPPLSELGSKNPGMLHSELEGEKQFAEMASPREVRELDADNDFSEDLGARNSQ